MRSKTKNILGKSKIISLFLSIGIVVIFLNYSGYADNFMQNFLKVNQSSLPELDAMYNVELNKDFNSDYKIFSYTENFYSQLQDKLGIPLLYNKLSEKNKYIIVDIQSDYKDYATLTFNNYILGDTTNHIYNEEKGLYSYNKGDEYLTPVSLTIDIILSEKQMETGFNTEYLGMYEFEDNYVSKQGYKVNIIRDASSKNDIPERFVIFVADGIRYTLKGRTSLENFKNIVDSMEYLN